MHLHFHVNVTGIVPTWINIFFFSEQFTPTLQRSNHDPLGSLHQYCMKNSPDLFVLVVLTDTLIYLNLYMYTTYEITIIFVI